MACASYRGCRSTRTARASAAERTAVAAAVGIEGIAGIEGPGARVCGSCSGDTAAAGARTTAAGEEVRNSVRALHTRPAGPGTDRHSALPALGRVGSGIRSSLGST